MPWASNGTLPASVRSTLPEAAQTRFRQVANGRMAAGDSEESAIRQGWHVVGVGWEKPKGGGRWVRKAVDVSEAVNLLDEAIELHDAHIEGEEPTSEASQDKLMNLMNQARDKLVEKADARRFVKAEVTKVDEELGLVLGWAICCKVDDEPYFDSQGDHIPEDAMLKAATDFMLHSRVAKEMHGGEQVGEVVFAFPLTAEVAKAMDIETGKTGLMIAMRPGPDVMAKYRSGEYSGFSIGGSRVKDEDVV